MPFLRRADLVLAQIALDGCVELAVVGHDQMGIRGHPDPDGSRFFSAAMSISAMSTLGSITVPER